jgi:hypothetical protein
MMPPLTHLQSILIAAGVLTVLSGTVLYWPLERLSDWLEGYGVPGNNLITETGHRFRHWIRSDARRVWKYRVAGIALGLAYIAIALMLG